jgi:hypothetical protein
MPYWTLSEGAELLIRGREFKQYLLVQSGISGWLLPDRLGSASLLAILLSCGKTHNVLSKFDRETPREVRTLESFIDPFLALALIDLGISVHFNCF